jgi:hypothetical protein
MRLAGIFPVGSLRTGQELFALGIPVPSAMSFLEQGLTAM